MVIGCGPVRVVYPTEMAQYYEDFSRIIGPSRVTSGTMQFEDDSFFEGNVIGLCVKPALGGWTVHIKQSMWTKSSEVYRKAVLFHELTHCVLDRMEHSLDPNSYMYRLQMTPDDINDQVLGFL
jgi:hypothetical protein